MGCRSVRLAFAAQSKASFYFTEGPVVPRCPLPLVALFSVVHLWSNADAFMSFKALSVVPGGVKSLKCTAISYASHRCHSSVLDLAEQFESSLCLRWFEC